MLNLHGSSYTTSDSDCADGTHVPSSFTCSTISSYVKLWDSRLSHLSFSQMAILLPHLNVKHVHDSICQINMSTG